jgi:hypothetical protein
MRSDARLLTAAAGRVLTRPTLRPTRGPIGHATLAEGARISDGAVPAFPRPTLSATALRPAVAAIGPLITLGNNAVTVR